MAKQAFALTESAKDSFVDAAATVAGDGRTLRVGELLEKGKGVISVDDPVEIDALNTVDALKQVSAKEADEIRKSSKKGGGDS